MTKVVYDKTLAIDSSRVEDQLINTMRDGDVIIRMYEWLKPAISVGRDQSTKGIKSELPVVRRCTGGNALYLGSGELCYTVLIKDRVVPSKMLERIHSGIRDEIGGALATDDRVDEYKSTECFNTVGKHEVMVQGKKLVGSAVTMQKGVYIHHGVIYMTDSYNELKNHTTEDSSMYKGRITSITEVGIEASFKDLQDIIVKVITRVVEA